MSRDRSPAVLLITGEIEQSVKRVRTALQLCRVSGRMRMQWMLTMLGSDLRVGVSYEAVSIIQGPVGWYSG